MSAIEADANGNLCRVVVRHVFPPMSIAQAQHAFEVDAGLVLLGLKPMPMIEGKIVRELVPIRDVRAGDS